MRHGTLGHVEQTGIAISTDLLNWTRHSGDPVVRNRPGGCDESFCLDKQYAHKILLVYNSQNGSFYVFYNAVPDTKGTTGGCGIGLITSKPRAKKAVEFEAKRSERSK